MNPKALGNLHNQLAADFGADAVVSLRLEKIGAPIEIDFGNALESERDEIEAIVRAYDLNTPDPDPEAFVASVAMATANTGLLLIAQRLAVVARSNSGELKAKFAEHAALPQAQKDVLRAAAQAAGLALD
jgi:hypothetical protein